MRFPTATSQRIYQKLVSGAPAFRNVHLDPHVLNLASVFGILTRLVKPEREGLDVRRSCAFTPGRRSRGAGE
jgi:serine protein kinase